MQEIELEKTYLAKYFPPNLVGCANEELLDIYIPISSVHPILRIRKKGNHHEITKKSPVNEGDASHQTEHTIRLSKEEYDILSKIPGKKVEKIRYYYDFKGRIAEIDVFQDALAGLVLIDFEFATVEEKDAFKMPDFCLADVAQEKLTAGGMICGKSYSDIEKSLEKFDYKKLLFEA
jgi:adenylate cyclase